MAETRKYSGGLYFCSACKSERDKTYIDDPIKRKDRFIKRVYGLTSEQMNEIYIRQDGKCKICKIAFDCSNKNTTACIDHNHKTGKVRGLLCHRCNIGLGTFEDDTRKLSMAIEYLKEYE